MDLISLVPDLTTTLAAGAGAVVLASLATSTLALRRSRAIARSSAALVAELAVFKDAAVSLGQHIDRRVAAPAMSERASTNSPLQGSTLQSPQVHSARAQPLHAQQVHAHPLHEVGAAVPALSTQAIAPDTQRAFELARQGASIDDLVAACDVSRTEAGLLLAMSRRGRRVLAG